MFPRACSMLALVCACLFLAQAQEPQDCPSNTRASDEARLRKDLKCAYHSKYRPVLNHQDTVNVSVDFLVKYISFNSLDESFTFHSWVSLVWKDEFLKWKPSDYGGIKMTLIESHEIWTPPLELFNADINRHRSHSFYKTCKVRFNGSVTCKPHMAYSSICRTNLRRWPYDTQHCVLQFGSWMHTGEQINYTFNKDRPVITNRYQDGPGWELIGLAQRRIPGKYSYAPNDSYPILNYAFLMKRQSAGPAAIVVIASVAIVVMTLMSLILDTEDDTRFIISFFSLFCHFIFLTEIGHEIPKKSAHTPLILLFMRDSMIVTLFVVLLTQVLMSLRKQTAPAPAWLSRVTRLVAASPMKYAVFTEIDLARPSDEMITLAEDDAETNADEDPHKVSVWLQLSNILNSVVFIISLITYAVLIAVYIPRDS